jgi:hypothetical protein
MIQQISNLESASSVRAKLNQLIDAVNYLNSITGSSNVGTAGTSGTAATSGTSGTVGYTPPPAPPTSGTSGTGGYTPPAQSNFSVSFYGSNPTAEALSTSMDACMANNTGMSRLVYVQDNTSTGEANQPAMGDRVYSDSMYMTLLGAGWYGFKNMVTFMNYSVQIDASGYVMMVSIC